MKYFKYIEFNNGGYAIGEPNADGDQVDGLMYEYWPDSNTMGIGEAHDGSINGFGIFEKKDKGFIITKYEDSEYADTILFESSTTYLEICSHQDGKFYGYDFVIFENGWRYYFYDKDDSMTRMIEYNNNTKKLGMFYAEPGGKCKWYREIGKNVIDWDVSLPVITFKNKVYPNCQFISGNNCINPQGGQGPCIDYFPDKGQTCIGTVNANNKYEGIVYSDLKDSIEVVQKSNGYNTGIDYLLKKDMSFWVYTWYNNDNSYSNVKVFGWPDDGVIEIRYYNYEGSEDFDGISIDKDFNVTIVLQHDADPRSGKNKKCVVYNYDDLYNADMDEDNNQEAEKQDEEEVEEEEVEEAPKKQLKIKPKSKKIMEKAKPKAKKDTGGAKKKSTSNDDWDGFFKVLGKKK